MIDSPCIKPLDDMPDVTMKFLEEARVFIGLERAGKTKETLMPLITREYVVSTIQALKGYLDRPMLPRQRPEHRFIIWAKDDAFDGMTDDVTAVAKQEVGTFGADSNVGFRED